MVRVFSQKHSLTSVGNVGINSVGMKVCIRNDSLEKQNVLRVFGRKALPTSYS